MSATRLLAELPDDARVYVPGVGEVSVRELVQARTEQNPALADERRATVAMWVRICTRNLCPAPTCPGDGPQETRA